MNINEFQSRDKKNQIFILGIIYTIIYVGFYIYENPVFHGKDWYYIITLIGLIFFLGFDKIYNFKETVEIIIKYIFITIILLINSNKNIDYYIEFYKTKIFNLRTFILIAFLIVIVLIRRSKIGKNEKIEQDDLFEERREDYRFIQKFISEKTHCKELSLGIDGEFGTGKTYLIEKILKNLDKKKYEIVRINSVTLSDDDIYTYIINRLIKLLKYNLIFLPNVEKTKKLFFLGVFERLAIDIKGLYYQDSVTDDLEAIKTELRKIKKTIVIIFDDLDRVSNTMKIDKIFSFISEFNNLGIKFIVLYNSENLKKIDEKFTRNYIEKYISLVKTLTPINFIYVLKTGIREYNFDENDFMFLYGFMDRTYRIKYENSNNDIDIWKALSEMEELTFTEVSLSKTRFTPRGIKIFLEEVAKYINLYKIDRRILIGYCFLKTFFYDEFYEKLDMNVDIDKTFPINIDFENGLSVSLTDLDLYKSLYLKRNELIFTMGYVDICNERISLDEDSMYLCTLNNYLEKLDIKYNENEYKNLNEEESFFKKIDLIKMKIDNLFFYSKNSISEEGKLNFLIRGILNYFMYFNSSRLNVKNNHEMICFGISKMKFLGNTVMVSSYKNFYNLMKETLRTEEMENINIVNEKQCYEKICFSFEKLCNQFYLKELEQSIFYMGLLYWPQAMAALTLFAKESEQILFFKAYRYHNIKMHNDILCVNDEYVQTFCSNEVKEKKILDMFIDDFISSEIAIRKEISIKLLCHNLKRLFYRCVDNQKLRVNPNANLNIFLLNLKKYLKSLELGIKDKIVMDELLRYYCFIDKLLKEINTNVFSDKVDLHLDFKTCDLTIKNKKLLDEQSDLKEKKHKIVDLFETSNMSFEEYIELCKYITSI